LHLFFQFIKNNEGRVAVKTINFLFVMLFSLAVAACGGGGSGGSGGGNAPPTPAPTYSISGTVSDPIGVTITVTGGTLNTGAITDASGKYTVTGLHDGNYTVTPSKQGYTFTPASTNITIHGANMTVTNFTAGAAVRANVSGTVSGTWVEGVTITMSNGANDTKATGIAGNYSFPGLASGVTYTFTPTLAGYTFTPASSTVAIPQFISAPVAVPNMVAASTIASYSISGTVSYTGTYTGTMSAGPIAIRLIPCPGCSSVSGTVAESGGAYTVRGLQPGNYTVVAEMEVPGTVSPNATNPFGISGPVSVSVANPNPAVNVTVADPPTVPAPGTPGSLRVAPGNSSALVMYSPAEGAYGREHATSYRIYWSTDPVVPAGSSRVDFAAQGDRTINFHVLSNLGNGDVYFKMSSFVGATESAPSAVTGPVTIGATSGLNTVSGAVIFPAAATGTLIVGLYSSTTGVYFTRIAITANPQSYSIAGVADGGYFPFAVVDTNSNGAIDSGEISSVNAIGGLITVGGGTTTTRNFTLSPASATASVSTEHYRDGTGWHSYRLMLGVNDGIKRAVAVTLVSGLNVAVPMDMSANRVISLDPNTRPNTGDSYMFRVTFADGSTANIPASVNGVLDSFATNLAASAGTTPTFSWGAPSPLLSTSYIYRLVLWGDTDQISWRYPQDFGLPSSTLSVLYNGAVLTSGNSYQWGVQVRDANGNSATSPSNFTVVP
jgi:hypothetical protein